MTLVQETEMANDEVDRRVLDAVKAGAKRARDVIVAVHGEYTGDHRIHRVIDRSLQRLRRAGRLQFSTGTGWLA
jgi:hypothetical protein